MYRHLLSFATALVLGGCVMMPVPSRPEPRYEPVLPPSQVPLPATVGAVYQSDTFDSLFVDRRALGVGDVVTIRLEERTSSQKSAETTVSKETDNQIVNPKILGSVVRGTGSDDLNAIESSTDFSGNAESDQSNSLSGTLTAVIAEVYPNGLMRVRGEKWLNLNRGEEYLRVSGLLRPEDIGDDNSVSSTRLADARIAYSGTGTLADANAPGWLARFFLSPKFPL
ncbi:MAG: flagellar basal body L-ring protein FlgH [Pseudomonadales bacterium]